MLLMQKPLRIAPGLKSEPRVPKAKDVAPSPLRITTMRGFPWPYSDHPAAYGTHEIASTAQASTHTK